MPLNDEKITELLFDVQRSIGRLEGKLDAHVMTVASHMAVTAESLTRQDMKNDEQDKAIKKVEINQARYATVASLIGTMGGWLSYHFWPFHT